jgi:hypothetical protein
MDVRMPWFDSRRAVPPSSNHDDLPNITRIDLITVPIFCFWDGLPPKSLPLPSYPSEQRAWVLSYVIFQPCLGEQQYWFNSALTVMSLGVLTAFLEVWST